MAVLSQHVGHHEGGQLRVRIGVDQAIVGQGVAQVAGLGIHQVQQGGFWVVGWGDRRDLVVLVATAVATISGASLSGVVLEVEGGRDQTKVRETSGRQPFKTVTVSSFTGTMKHTISYLLHLEITVINSRGLHVD